MVKIVVVRMMHDGKSAFRISVKTVGTFETDEAFFRYLESQAGEAWQFRQYTPQALGDLLDEMGGKSLVHTAWQAYQRRRDMLVIGIGEDEDPFFFAVTPDLDIAALRRDWCKRFCAAHGLHIIMR